MYPILFQFGPITIYSFGAFMALAALSAAWVVSLELKRRGYNPELASTMVFAAAIGGLIGARLLFILEEWQNFLAAPLNYIFTGAGFTWYGGLFGGVIAVSWVVKKIRSLGWSERTSGASRWPLLTVSVASAATSPATAIGAPSPTCRGAWLTPMRSSVGSILRRCSLSAGHAGTSDADLRVFGIFVHFRHSLVAQEKKLCAGNPRLALFDPRRHGSIRRRILARESNRRFWLVRGTVDQPLVDGARAVALVRAAGCVQSSPRKSKVTKQQQRDFDPSSIPKTCKFSTSMINRFEHSEASEADTPLALGVAPFFA